MKTLAPYHHMATHRAIKHTQTQVIITHKNMKELPVWTAKLTRLEDEPDTTGYAPRMNARSVFVLGMDHDNKLHLLHYGFDTKWSILSGEDFKRFREWHQTVVAKNPGNADIQIAGLDSNQALNEAFFSLYPDLIYPTNHQVLKINLSTLSKHAKKVEWNSTYRPLTPRVQHYLLQTDEPRIMLINSTHKEAWDLTDLMQDPKYNELLNTLMGSTSSTTTTTRRKGFRSGVSYPNNNDAGEFRSRSNSSAADLLDDFFGHKLSVFAREGSPKTKMVARATSNKLAEYRLGSMGSFARVHLNRDYLNVLDAHRLGLETKNLYIITPTAEAYYFSEQDVHGLFIRSIEMRKNKGKDAEVDDVVDVKPQPTEQLTIEKVDDELPKEIGEAINDLLAGKSGELTPQLFSAASLTPFRTHVDNSRQLMLSGHLGQSLDACPTSASHNRRANDYLNHTSESSGAKFDIGDGNNRSTEKPVVEQSVFQSQELGRKLSDWSRLDITLSVEDLETAKYNWGKRTLIARELGAIDIEELYIGDEPVYRIVFDDVYQNILWELCVHETPIVSKLLVKGANYIVSTHNESWLVCDDVVYYINMHINPNVV